jgi:hypothetical protein
MQISEPIKALLNRSKEGNEKARVTVRLQRDIASGKEFGSSWQR